ncbi:unnamed protein product, partial [Nesidiocoris tenuis]
MNPPKLSSFLDRLLFDVVSPEQLKFRFKLERKQKSIFPFSHIFPIRTNVPLDTRIRNRGNPNNNIW